MIKWEPLEEFFNHNPKVLKNFRIMGIASCKMWIKGEKVDKVIYLYKHIDTRRYINIDNYGNCYKFDFLKDQSYYNPISKEEAIKHVFS